MRLSLFALVAVVALPLAQVVADTIAYDNQPTGGLQNYGNNLGLDFTVNSPILITQLGAFDNGVVANLNGVAGGTGIDVGIFSLSSETLVGTSVHFNSTTDAGTQINADAFLPVHINLPAGNYTVVALNDGNYNSGGGVNASSTENSGGGLISFIGGGRYGNGPTLAFPGGTDGGPTNRYDAGTFQFRAAPEPSSFVLGALGVVGLLWAARRRRKV